MEGEIQKLTERLQDKDGFGFEIRWEHTEHFARFSVHELDGSNIDGVDVWEPSEKQYVHGFIKWDGCTEIEFEETPNGYSYHWCGFRDFARLWGLLLHLYIGAFERMGREPDDCDSEGQAVFEKAMRIRAAARERAAEQGPKPDVSDVVLASERGD